MLLAPGSIGVSKVTGEGRGATRAMADDDSDHGNGGVPDEINCMGPDYRRMKVKRVRLGRCLCGRISQWRFRMVDAPERSGYDHHPESDPESQFYNSDDSEESIPRQQRRVTLGAINEVLLEHLEDNGKASVQSTQSQVVSDPALGTVPSGDGNGAAAASVGKSLGCRLRLVI